MSFKTVDVIIQAGHREISNALFHILFHTIFSYGLHMAIGHANVSKINAMTICISWKNYYFEF